MINNHGGVETAKRLIAQGAKKRKYIRWIYYALSLRQIGLNNGKILFVRRNTALYLLRMKLRIAKWY